MQRHLVVLKSIIEIKKLPGIGDYTANALLGLVYNEPRIAVDGNVRRVFSRNLNIEENKINFDKFIISKSVFLALCVPIILILIWFIAKMVRKKINKIK